MILVTSGAYVDAEFRNEFGALPPALLPIGNRRLFQRQAELLERCLPGEKRVISLPESFAVTDVDRALLSASGFDLVTVPEPLSLGESILSAVNAVGAYDDPLRILHGDTLLDTLPLALDVISVSDTSEDYEWEFDAAAGEPGDMVWAGYFAFSQPRSFIRQLVAQRGGFVRAVRAYDGEHGMRRELADSWKDFGHINTYFKARMRITTERAFNSLSVHERVVTKRGHDAKIRSEAMWFEHLPRALRLFTPQLVELNLGDAEHPPFYSLEYLCQPPLNELFVHGSKPPPFWRGVFDEIDRWLRMAVAGAPAAPSTFEDSRRQLLVGKSLARIEEFAAQAGVSTATTLELNGRPVGSLAAITQHAIDRAMGAPAIPGILHGDLCFSNILHDSRSRGIKVIDPRGVDPSGPGSLVGDLAYDLAKVSHSVLGLYDHIVAGIFRCHVVSATRFEFRPEPDMRVKAIQSLFKEYRFLGQHTAAAFEAHMLLLFASMLPLHYDDKARQSTLLANVLRLHLQQTAPPERA